MAPILTALALSLIASTASAASTTFQPLAAEPTVEARADAKDLVVKLAMERICTGKRRILAASPEQGPSLEQRIDEQFRRRHGVGWEIALGPPGVAITVRATVLTTEPLVSDLNSEQRGRVCVQNRIRLLHALEPRPSS